MTLLRKIDFFISRIEGIVIVALLTVMIFTATAQIILRNFFHAGIPWADIFLRNLVLWICFIGASLATMERKHINIDVLTQFLSPKQKKASDFAIYLASSIVCGFLAMAAWQFMIDERSGEGFLFGKIPTWYFLTVIPLSLFLMGVRFFFYSIESLLKMPAGNVP